VWSKSPSTGDIPSKRQGHSATLYGSTLWVFGGSNSMGYLNDLYSLNLETVIFNNTREYGKNMNLKELLLLLELILGLL